MIKKQADWSKWNDKESNFKKYEHIESQLIYGQLLKQKPEATIIILSYKREDGLIRALESAIAQDYQGNYQIMVLDDAGEITNIDAIMKKYCDTYQNVCYYRHKQNLGEPGNWNRACQLCTSDWYCLLHDDDALKSSYLSTMIPMTKTLKKEYGLLGVYNETFDERKKETKPGVVQSLVQMFIKMNKGKLIPLTMKDNMKDIYVLSTCLFLRKEKVMNIGGSNDDYFPSSDFVFAAKMNYYHGIAFLPEVLADRGVYDNQSLKPEVCHDSIRCAYHHTIEMCKLYSYSPKKTQKIASRAAVIAEIGVKGYNDVDYGETKKELGMKPKYNKPIVIFLINLYSKWNWGKLLFRKE